LADDREPRHAAVRRLLATLWQGGGIAVTSDYVLDEAFTLVFRRLPFTKARRFVTTFDLGEQEGSLQLERIASERFAEAKALRMRLRDKPLISFTDLTTMVLMRELRLTQIVTADDHFRHVGLGFELLP
jgi:predicted nucleic acid-binding protein